MSENNESVRTQSLSIQAYSYLRRALMDGQYIPGQKIKLQEVANELEISVTPVREALCRLVSEQVLSQVDRRSVRVPIILADRYREIRDLRLLLEGEAAAKAAERATPAEVGRLADIHERMRAASEKKNLRSMLIENRRFHQGLHETAQMPILSRMVENLWLQCGPMMNAFVKAPLPVLRKRHPHLHVLDALRTRDGPLARLSIQQDITLSTDRILAYLEMRQQVEGVAEGDQRKRPAPRKSRAAA